MTADFQVGRSPVQHGMTFCRLSPPNVENLCLETKKFFSPESLIRDVLSLNYADHNLSD